MLFALVAPDDSHDALATLCMLIINCSKVAQFKYHILILPGSQMIFSQAPFIIVDAWLIFCKQ